MCIYMEFRVRPVPKSLIIWIVCGPDLITAEQILGVNQYEI